jgi:hypothetical protein
VRDSGRGSNRAMCTSVIFARTCKHGDENRVGVKICREDRPATNYALLVYAAIFVISAHYFSRTDLARNWLGVLTIATFIIHWCMLHLFQRAIEKFRNRLGWIYRTYFSAEERAGLDVQLEPRSYWYQPEVYVGLIAVSFVGAVLTAVYLWSVR